MNKTLKRQVVVDTLIKNAKFAADKARSSLDANEMICGFSCATALGVLALEFSLDRVPTPHESECIVLLTEVYIRGNE